MKIFLIVKFLKNLVIGIDPNLFTSIQIKKIFTYNKIKLIKKKSDR